jgi:hypothetical protein
MNYQTKNRIQNTQRGTASRNHVRGGERPFLGVCGVFFVSCLTLLVFGFIHTTSAAPNYEINYQGKLTNASNVAVANDTYNIRFWLTTSPTIATTSAVWTEELTGTNKVQVTNGLFSIMLGSTTPLTGVDFNQPLYLGVEVGGTSTPLWDGEMSPRKILGTVPSAFEAENARTIDNLATTSLLRSDVDDTASGLLTFTGGFVSTASSTIAGLTTDIATTTTLVIGNSPFTSLTGTGLTNTGGVLTTTLGTDITTGEIADGDHGFFSYASGIASLDTNGLSSSNILSALTDETGTDNLVFSTNPLLSGFRSFASSTIGDGTGTGGLTVLGNSTTTGDAKISGGLAVAGITITDFQNINMSSGDAIQWGSSLTRLYGASATLNFITNSINRLFIGQYGNIGVGTTTPESSFVIQSASSTIPVLTVASTSGSSLLTVLGNGYVGIGTNAPTAELNIYKNNGSDDVTAYIQNGSASGGADAILRIGTTNSTGNPYVQYYTQGVAYWSAGMNSNSNKFVITPATDPTSAVINNSFYMTSVGMIGLGTSTPSSKLTIEQGMTGTGNLFQIASSSNGTATTTLFVVDQYGNVGIGTTSPSSLLAVQGLVTGANFFAYSTTSTTTLAGGLDVGNGGLVYDLESGETYIGSLISGTQTFDYDAGTVQWTDLPIWEAGLDTPQSYTASIGGNEMLTIYGLSSGASTTYNNMVGIGSSTPSRFLTVAGDSYFTNNITSASSTLGYATSTSLYTATFGLGSDYITDLTGTGLSVTNGVLNVTGDGLSNWLTLNGALTPSTTLGIRINASSTIGDGTGAGGLTILGNSTTTGSASVIGALSAASMAVTSGSTYSLGDKVALTNSGGVMSIGSSAIWTGLTFGPGATPRMSIDSSGNVGIGTSTPLSTLTIQGSGTTNPFTIASSTGASMFSVNSIGQVTVPGVIIANGGILGSDALYLDGRFGANVNINSIWKGNVGIGTSSPTASLFVQGASSTIPVLNVASSTGASLFTVLANGSVGIGSSTPVAKLSVVGTGGSSNVFAFASSTGSNLLTLGADGRMVFGNNASADIFLNGGKTTENPQSNQNNVAIGNGAFTYYTSDATHNTALGYQALRGSSTVPMTGGFNFAVGSFALLTNTTGSFNNAFGYQALYSNTTGSSNNALGNSALISNTTGSNNNAFGSSALYTNTTGSNNNALGKSALNNNTTGTNNNVLGFVALLNNTTGSNNIAIGGGVQFDSGVLYNNTTGSGNIGLGFQAGDTITTGNSNVFLGHIADASADNLSTSTAIGAGAVVGCSNCLVLGGTGVNYVNVGIGTTSPNARLTVRGTGTTNPFLVASSTGATSLAVLASGDVEIPGNIISAGINWTTRTAASTTVGYESIIYGNGRFVAVGSKVAMTSSDGINWATSTPATDSYWGDITYGNGLFVAVGTTTPGIDRVMTSPDGITWTARSAAGNDDNWNAITYGNGLFVAVGNTGDRVMTSPDGITWTARPAVGDDDNWRAITYGNGLFVAVGSSGDRVMTSPDGISWVAQSASGDDDLWASITYGNGLFVVGGLPAFAGNSMITSPDGITWTERSVAGDNDYWVTIAYGNGLFVAMSYFFGNPEGIITSPDGINWTVRSALASSDRWNSVAYGNGMFVGVGIQASGNQRSVITSGKTFTNALATNNIYQGGMSVLGGTFNIGTTTPTTSPLYGLNVLNVASTSGASLLTIANSGNVGIGTSTPLSTLTIQGSGTKNPFAVASSTGDSLFSINSSGILNIRSGTSSQAFTNIFVNGGSATTTVLRNIALGFESLSNITTGADDNIAFGYQALYGSSTAKMTGQNNFAVGYQSLFNNTTGSENFSMGYNSLFSNTTGSRNIAIGSGYSAASGPSLQFNTTGSDNIALGVQSLANNTSGNANIAMGNSNALFSNITGGYNIAFGQSALSQSVSGSENISIGRYSGYLLGDTATSSGNTFLGAYAGQTQTRGNNNIFIGYDSSVASTTGSNQLSIGNLIYGLNTASGASVSTGTIGIGTSSPRSTLTIQGSGATNPFLVASSSGSSLFTVLANGNVGVGTSSPLALLNLDKRSLTGSVVGGMKQFLSYINSTESAVYYGDESYFVNAPTATSTFVGKMIRIEDTSTLGNTVRGLEAQAFRGTNTKGENTGLSGYGRTFGVRGTTLGDAGSVYVPAGVFAESQGTTQGNALRAYSGTLTSEDLVSLFHDGSAFAGTGLSMNFGNSGGSFAATSSAKFIDFQVGGTSKFTVTAAGTTTIGDGTTANMAGLQIGFGGLCVDNDGSCTASTTGRITSVSSASGNSDLAEMYFSSDALEAGEIVSLVGGLSVGRASGASADAVIGVISTKPGLIMGFDDTSLVAGETAYPVALKGRVPIKLSTENGPIMKGDRIALSSIPGIGMKAHDGDTVVGIALEDYSGDYAYSPAYLNQFGDDLVKAKMQVRSQETDARTQDGCSYGGGNAQGEAQCVKDKVAPIKPVTVSVDTRTEALRVLRAEEATRAQTTGGQEVTIGQAVMFVHLHDFVSRGGRDILAELSATTSVIDGNGTETLWDRVKTLAQNFVDGVLRVTGIKTEELCVGSVCVDEATFLRMVENAGGSQTGGDTDAGGEDVTTDEGGSGDSEGSPVEETPPQEDPMPPSEDPAPVIESPVEEPPAEPVQEEVPPEPEPAPLETPQEPAPEVPAV